MTVVSAAIVGAGIIPNAIISTAKPSQNHNARCFFMIDRLSRASLTELSKQNAPQDQQYQTANATNPEHKVEGQFRRIDFFFVYVEVQTPRSEECPYPFRWLKERCGD
jgi:hypothetical protein